LDGLYGQFQAAVLLPIYAVGRIEMPKGMSACVFGIAVVINDTGSDLHRTYDPFDDA
jgi:hypothetical protein